MPVYTWSKNGIPLNGKNYAIKDGSLTIKNVKPDDTATYSCIAQNYLGRLESSMKLYVLGKLKKIIIWNLFYENYQNLNFI